MSSRENFLGTQKRVRIRHGERVIIVRVIEVLPHIPEYVSYIQGSCEILRCRAT